MTQVSVPLTLSGVMPENQKPKAVNREVPPPFAAFARQLRADMERLGLSTREVAALCKVRYETARLWTHGYNMPRPKKMDALSKLLGRPASQLQFPNDAPPGVVLMPIADVTPDEQMLIDMYRRLPDPARKALRARASELLEAFGKKSPANPFGRGHSQ